jgi:hypothetical protein
MQRNIENPIYHFRNIVGKIAYIVTMLLRLGYLVGAGWGIALIANFVSKRWFGREIDWSAIWEAATSFGWIQLLLVAVVLVLIRRIVIRLNQPDTKPSER